MKRIIPHLKKSRWQISVVGFVQGVGFRPFVAVLAKSIGLSGFIFNTSSGVTIEIEGSPSKLDRFYRKLRTEKPIQAKYFSLKKKTILPINSSAFQIRSSVSETIGDRWILPDISLCRECDREIFDHASRRHHYPFTSCTNCGPRFSIISDLPYDRPNTSMKQFSLCPLCKKEYADQLDRRYHAQPIACPACGPSLQLLGPKKSMESGDQVLAKVRDLLLSGSIIGVRGLGGFQIILDATNQNAVALLRARKHRPDKPFALLFKDLKSVQKYAYLSKTEAKAIRSAAAPIVIIRKKNHTNLSDLIAPNNPNLGVMIVSNPLLAIISKMVGRPLICTSGNIYGEPILTDNLQAIEKLGSLVDYFLVHNREILHHVDDSVVTFAGRLPVFIRRARGYVPEPIFAPINLPPLISLGGQQKNTIALSQNRQVIVSQHIGDLNSPASMDRLKDVSLEYQRIFKIKPRFVVCDAHPEYENHQFARTLGLPVIQVYHHQSHIAACMLEHQLQEKVLGIAWDGTGYGPDKTIWGGEFLVTNLINTERVATIKSFQLIGGDMAALEPRRIALALLFEIHKLQAFVHPWTINHFSPDELVVFKRMLLDKNQTITTTSIGRLFDGIASLLDVEHKISFDAQAAMGLEFLCQNVNVAAYPFDINSNSILELDWRPMIEAILKDFNFGINKHLISGRYHRTLVEMILKVSNTLKLKKIVLSGGCFQNKRLLTASVRALRASMYTVYTHHQLPSNDGGLSAGQIYQAAKQF